MFSRQNFIPTLALLLLALPASAGSLLYVVTGPPGASDELFGTFDLATGGFTQIGPGTEASTGLVSGPNGQLLALGLSGNLNSINPVTGATALIGPTGLVDCSDPFSSPCGPKSANAIGSAGGQIYATDFQNRLYQINPFTGIAALIGQTGVPALPFTPITTNPDNTFNAYDETLFGANGSLYATFDAFTVNLDTFALGTLVIAPDLYRIDPKTGATTLIGPTDLNLGAAGAINGLYYAFNDVQSKVVTLDLATGHTSPVTDFDPGIGIVTGVAATPEPSSAVLAVIGFVGLAIGARRKRAVVKHQAKRPVAS